MEKAPLNQALSPVPGYKTSSSGLCIGASMKSIQTTLLKILHVPVLSFRPVSWILKLLCREGDRRRAIWTG